MRAQLLRPFLFSFKFLSGVKSRERVRQCSWLSSQPASRRPTELACSKSHFPRPNQTRRCTHTHPPNYLARVLGQSYRAFVNSFLRFLEQFFRKGECPSVNACDLSLPRIRTPKVAARRNKWLLNHWDDGLYDDGCTS